MLNLPADHIEEVNGMPIRIRMKEMIARHQVKTDQHLTYEGIQRILKEQHGIKVGINTLSLMANNKVQYVNLKLTSALCTILGCRLQDLLDHVKDKPIEPEEEEGGVADS